MSTYDIRTGPPVESLADVLRSIASKAATDVRSLQRISVFGGLHYGGGCEFGTCGDTCESDTCDVTCDETNTLCGYTGGYCGVQTCFCSCYQTCGMDTE